ncbi:hypothetical protein [Roseisolibacter agri]|uniref:Outer membrane protein beta-barrel domain-containing protein n=1 Tax=Roseisolibacter agri TaxID=2014610 RepID=A0AA37Q744_9BACT|nr:hypothetical protein [Roseisolibacter agri]GLC25912.1 hypothetical protein rosag_24250 [Roseisolibacter agri]
MQGKRAFDRLTVLCCVCTVLAHAAPLAAQSAGPRAHAAVLLGGGISENIAAPGVGASVAARVRQWRGARLEAELAGLGFATEGMVCTLGARICDTRLLSGAAWASALLVVGPGGSVGGRGVYAQAGAGPYSAWGIGCLSAGRGCEQGIRALGLQGSVGVGTRFAIGTRTWAAGVRAVTLERATGRRGVVTLLEFGPAF